MRIAITGSSGFIGSGLVAALARAGHRIDRLVRRAPAPGSTDLSWNPQTRQIDAAGLEGVDAVVHLAGENLAAGRWTAERKRSILESRRLGTRLLAEALAGLQRKPKTLISASAIGFYGDAGDRDVDESSPRGTGFLAEVCQAWEEATLPAAAAGIHVVNLRTGMVLAAHGGGLARMLLPFRLGLGGKLGSGRQYVSWIAFADHLAAIQHLLAAKGISGPVNAVSPAPVTNAEFTRALARALRRPALFPLPAPIIRLIFGEMGQAVLLEGAKVHPTKLLESGFRFELPTLEDALRAALGKPAITPAGR